MSICVVVDSIISVLLGLLLGILCSSCVRPDTFPLDFFFAERHTVMSNFHIETTIGEFNVVE